jgi:hypothetical protein
LTRPILSLQGELKFEDHFLGEFCDEQMVPGHPDNHSQCIPFSVIMYILWAVFIVAVRIALSNL